MLRQLGVDLIDDVQRAAHHQPVARVTAQEGQFLHIARRGEEDAIRLTGHQQPCVMQHLVGAWNEVALHGIGVLRHRIGSHAHLRHRAGGDDYEVVRHDVRVLEDDLHGLAALGVQLGAIEQHGIADRPHEDGDDLQFLQRATVCFAACGGQAIDDPARQCRRLATVRIGAVLHRQRGEICHKLFRHRVVFVRRPAAFIEFRQRVDGGVTQFLLRQHRCQHGDDVVAAVREVAQRRHGCATHLRFGHTLEFVGGDRLLLTARRLPARPEGVRAAAVVIGDHQVVFAGFQMDFARLLDRAVWAVVVHHALLVDVQPRTVIAACEERVFTAFGDEQLGRVTHGERVALGDDRVVEVNRVGGGAGVRPHAREDFDRRVARRSGEVVDLHALAAAGFHALRQLPRQRSQVRIHRLTGLMVGDECRRRGELAQPRRRTARQLPRRVHVAVDADQRGVAQLACDGQRTVRGEFLQPLTHGLEIGREFAGGENRCKLCDGIGRASSVSDLQRLEQLRRRFGVVQLCDRFECFLPLRQRNAVAHQHRLIHLRGARQVDQFRIGDALQQIRHTRRVVLSNRLAVRQRLLPERVELPHRFAEDIVDIFIRRPLQCQQSDVGCRAITEEACRTHRLESHRGVLILGSRTQQRHRVGNPVAPVAQDDGRRRTGAMVLRPQQLLEQRFVHHVVRLEQPQRFEQMMLVVRIVGAQRIDPLARRGDHRLCVATRQLKLRPIPHAVLRLLEQIQQRFNRLVRDRLRIQQGTAFVNHPVDAAVLTVATWIAHVMLHVTDDRVLPVGEVNRAVGTDLEVHRSEVGVGRSDDRLHFHAANARAVLFQTVLENSLEADHVAHEEVALQFFGEVAAGEDFRGRQGARALLIHLRRSRVLLVGAVEMTGDQRGVIRLSAGAIGDDLLSPTIDGVPVRVGEAVRHVPFGFERSRVESPDRAVEVAGGAVGRLHLAAVEHTFAEVEPSAVQQEAVGRVVRVARREVAQEARVLVGLAVAIGVLQVNEVGRLRDEHTVVPELKAGGIPQVVGEGGALVGLAVTIGVLQHEQTRAQRRADLPTGVVLPHRDPEPAVHVEGDLHGVHQFGEVLLRSEELNLHALGDFHLGDGVFTAEETVLPLGTIAGLVGRHGDVRREIRVIRRKFAALCGCPDRLVAIGRHHLEDFHFPQHDGAVGQTVVIEVRSTAVDVVTIGVAVALEPVEVFVEDRLTQLGDGGVIHGGTRAEERMVDRRCKPAVAALVLMDAVDRQRFSRGFIRFERGVEEVDEADVVVVSHLGDSAGVKLDVGVAVGSAGEIGRVDVFDRQRREEHQARRAPAAVVAGGDPFDEGRQILLELVEPREAGERLVEPDEGEDNVRLGAAEPFILAAEAVDAELHAQFVAGVSDVAHDQFLIGEARLDRRLQPAIVLDPLRHAGTDDRDVIALGEFEWLRGGGFGGDGTGRDDSPQNQRRQQQQLPHERAGTGVNHWITHL